MKVLDNSIILENLVFNGNRAWSSLFDDEISIFDNTLITEIKFYKILL